VNTPHLALGATAPMSFPLADGWIRGLLPPGTLGAYVLLAGSQPLYVGRSDTCLASRLRAHELGDVATHVAWKICLSTGSAFHAESHWYHCLGRHWQLMNRVHPARPWGWRGPCPFCGTELEHAHQAIAALNAVGFDHNNRAQPGGGPGDDA
jgi:hypothetical protein